MITPYNTAVRAPVQIQKAEARFAFSFSPQPKKRDMMLAPPTPKRLEIAVISVKSGIASVAAATSFGSPSCPMKKVSAML